jgi:hypothetical protein
VFLIFHVCFSKYCDGENNLYRKMLEKSTGVPFGELPDTALARYVIL